MAWKRSGVRVPLGPPCSFYCVGIVNLVIFPTLNMEHAIIRINGKQYIVTKGSLMKLDRVEETTPVEILLFESEKGTIIGEPSIEGFGVKFEILEDKKDKKISIRRFKSKSKYRKEHGHRQPISIVKISDFGKGIKTSFVYSTRNAVEEIEMVETEVKKGQPKEEKVEKKEKKTDETKKVTKSKVVKKKE